MNAVSDSPRYVHIIPAREAESVLGRALVALEDAGFLEVECLDEGLCDDLIAHLLCARLDQRARKRGFDLPWEIASCDYDGAGNLMVELEFEDERAPVLFKTFVG